MISLFKKYPRLISTLGHYPLGVLPTPVEKLEHLNDQLKTKGLYIKRDDLSGELYGGNKVRKLEFIFNEAKKNNVKRVLTSGAAGSNHALAVATYGTRAGFKVVLMLVGQPDGPGIRNNLLADYCTGADMYLDNTYEEHAKSIQKMSEKYAQIDGVEPFVIVPGGSSAIGAIGYVNAVFELKEQIDAGLIPEPSIIYIAFGTMGTAAGLLLGIKAAGIKSRLVAVRVVPLNVADTKKFKELYDATNRVLNNKDSTFPVCEFTSDDFTINDEFLGAGYGIITQKSQEAIDMLCKHEGIKLDGVYTGKTFAAFTQYAQIKSSANETILFWNTKNSRPISQQVKTTDYRCLPEQFHSYFTT